MMSPMPAPDFNRQLDLCEQSQFEVQRFAEDFAAVQLRYIADELSRAPAPPVSAGPSTDLDWRTPAKLRDSGIDPTWVSTTRTLAERFLHIDVAYLGDWSAVRRYLDTALLSEKQERLLFPLLHRLQRPVTVSRRRLTKTDLIPEVQRLNRLLNLIY